MHGYLGAELFMEVGGIAGMVKVSMGYHDELEMARLAARADEFLFKLGVLVGSRGVDQDKAGVSFYEIAIYATQSIR